jgi:phage shock protein C
MIAGLCAGLADTYGWDLSLVRLIAALGIIFSGSIFFWAYLVGWIVVPEEPFFVPPVPPPPPSA